MLLVSHVGHAKQKHEETYQPRCRSRQFNSCPKIAPLSRALFDDLTKVYKAIIPCFLIFALIVLLVKVCAIAAASEYS